MSKMSNLALEIDTRVAEEMAVFEHDLIEEMVHQINKTIVGAIQIGEFKAEKPRIMGMLDMLSVLTRKYYTLTDASGEIVEVIF